MKHSAPPAYSFGSKTPAEPKLTPLYNPGPGTYDLRHDYELKASTNPATGAPVAKTTSFGAGTRDFLSKENSVPGPGAYEIKHFVEKRESKSEDGHRHLSAHSKKSLKDRMNNAKLVFPGPGTYNPQKLNTRVAFSMGNRTSSLMKGESAAVPGPGAYDPNSKAKQPNSRMTR